MLDVKDFTHLSAGSRITIGIGGSGYPVALLKGIDRDDFLTALTLILGDITDDDSVFIPSL